MSRNEGLVEQLGGEGVELWAPSFQIKATPRQVLEGKVVLIFFSALWCGPCKRFTPILQGLFQKLKSRADVEPFEVVFCSRDRTKADYDVYIKHMPWWCLPFNSPCIDHIANRYQVAGIPHVVIVDTDGRVLVQDGVQDISLDPCGQSFPWRRKLLRELMPIRYLKNAQGVYPMGDLDDKYLVLYFSAKWCASCRHFTPLLSEAYHRLRDTRDNFEILFVSSDRTSGDFDEFFGEMPFGALEYDDQTAKAAILTKLQVRHIPTLVVLGPCPADGGDRPLLNANAREIFEHGDYISEFPFGPKLYGDLGTTKHNVMASRCIIVFHENCDNEDNKNIREALQLASTECGEENVLFLWAFSESDLSSSIRQALQLGPISREPLVVLLDVPNKSYFLSAAPTEISRDSILGFLTSPGERHQL